MDANKLLPFNKVYDSEKDLDVMVETVSEGEFIVLDVTFGKSTITEEVHEKWCREHPDDGRYSYTIKQADRILKYKKEESDEDNSVPNEKNTLESLFWFNEEFFNNADHETQQQIKLSIQQILEYITKKIDLAKHNVNKA